MTREEFDQTVNALHQELDELIGKRQPMKPHPSPHDYVQRKQYKQVAGTLVMQDIEGPDDQLQVHQPQRKRGKEEHRSTRATRGAEAPIFECPILIKQGHAQYIPWAGQDLDTLVSAFQTFMKVLESGSEHSKKKKQLENFWPWVTLKPCLQSAWEPPR